MPHFTLICTAEGLELPVLIGLPGTVLQNLQTAGLPIPHPAPIQGIIDTETNITCVAPRVLTQLSLRPAGQGTTQTLAGPLQVNLFEVSLSIPPAGGLTTFLLTLPQLLIGEASALGPDIEALIGRDV